MIRFMIKAALAKAIFTITMFYMTKCKQYDNVKEVVHSYKPTENYHLITVCPAHNCFTLNDVIALLSTCSGAVEHNGAFRSW